MLKKATRCIVSCFLCFMLNFNENSLEYAFLLQEDSWVIKNGKFPLPSEEENCHLVEITEEDVARVVTSIPKLDTLILIKHMLKKHSFQVGIYFFKVAFTVERHNYKKNCKDFQNLKTIVKRKDFSI